MVRAAAEGDVRVVRALGPEPVGVGEPARVPVARGQRQHHMVAPANRRPRRLDVGQRGTRRQLHGRVVPQHLLDDRRGVLGVGGEALEDLGMAQQRLRAVRDEVDGRLVPGDEQHPEGEREVQRAHAPGRVVPGQHAGDQIVARCRAPPPDQLLQIGAPLLAGDLGLLDLPLAQALFGVEGPRQHARELMEDRLVLARHAQQFADHRDRQGVGEIRDQFQPARTVAHMGVEQLGDPGLDVGAHPEDAREELVGHERAQVVVAGRVQAEEGLDVLVRGAGLGRLRVAGAHARVPQQPRDLGVRADHPRVLAEPLHGPLAEPGEQRIGVGAVGVVDDLAERGGGGERRGGGRCGHDGSFLGARAVGRVEG